MPKSSFSGLGEGWGLSCRDHSYGLVTWMCPS